MNQEIYMRIKEQENLIYNIAHRYSSSYNLEDLYQSGVIGVIKAYKKYDKSFNTKFSTYAYDYILGEIVDFIRKDRNIIISEENFRIYKKYQKVKELLNAKYEREATFNEICSFMEMKEGDLLKIIQSVAFTKSYEPTDDNQTFYEEDYDTKLYVSEMLESLNDFDKSLISCRYYQGLTQSETADTLGVSQVKVSRQEKLILSKIRANNLSH